MYSWVIKFTDLKGLKVITTGLSYLNRKPDSERLLMQSPIYMIITDIYLGMERL